MLRWRDVMAYARSGNPTPPNKVEKSEAEWKAQLTEEEYYVTRKRGTERAHSSDMCNAFDPGKYACKCCGTPLFDSSEKFQSGTGWPSFTQPMEVEHVAYHEDNTFGMSRIEVTCNVCEAHLGHVFPDGPDPSGLRYCVNAVSLQKMKD
ncbi:peptide-methionine (R)-S-oxide reductase MsrB [Marinoscillum furvescens]|uniref:peptide-methionine (R)-S-oxide reductase n=1 Tax=Marinoscillum furvescens DSM 4134 TaxID=1122208 RepID=A0A3D9L7A1_MARFU|nr:peptide-methionine (R)-S-oxide reductase MsrB [Marinoscillum furvescens]REE02195.1 peptide-methionine (R)-S-oxide reductase [Marinoscillum furvescens DSM 4134]